ncbi:MAG: lysylphosphatidylglycerol synthase transmembrane domain-containing protein [Candidatus Woesearchaeota archaeon]
MKNIRKNVHFMGMWREGLFLFFLILGDLAKNIKGRVLLFCTMGTHNYRPFLKVMIEIALIILFLYLFIRKISFDDFLVLKHIVNWSLIPFLIFFNGFIPFFWSLGWYVILRTFFRINCLEVVFAKFSSQAISYITPFIGLGGDVFVPTILAKKDRDLKTIYATILTERLIEVITFMGLISFATLYLLFFKNMIPFWLKILIAIAGFSFFFILILFFIFLRKSKPFLSNFFASIFRKKHIKYHFLISFVNSLKEFEEKTFFILKKENKKTIAKTFFFKFLGVMVELLKHMMIFYLLGFRENLLFFASVSLSSLVLMALTSFIPASLGGYEYFSMLLFSSVGLSTRHILGYLLLIRLLYFTNSSIGLIYYFIRKGQILKEAISKNKII